MPKTSLWIEIKRFSMQCVCVWEEESVCVFVYVRACVRASVYARKLTTNALATRVGQWGGFRRSGCGAFWANPEPATTRKTVPYCRGTCVLMRRLLQEGEKGSDSGSNIIAQRLSSRLSGAVEACKAVCWAYAYGSWGGRTLVMSFLMFFDFFW